MKNWIRCLIVVVAGVGEILHAQWINPAPSGWANKLNKIYAVTPNIIVASGFTQLYARTTDGGTNWGTNSVNIPLRRAFTFADAQTGFVANDTSGLLKTTDAGATWTQKVSTGAGDSIAYVTFVNSTTGWVGGKAGLLKKTTDGGSTWNSQTVPTIVVASIYTINHGDWSFGEFSCVDANNGWVRATDVKTAAAGFQTVFRTTDGGTTWTLPVELYAARGITQLSHLYFATTTNGWAVIPYKLTGSGPDVVFHMRIMRTTNSGTSWDTVQVTQGANSPDFNALQASNATTVYIGGSRPEGGYGIYRSTDAGLTWSSMSINSPTDSSVVTDLDVRGTTGWACGGHTIGGFGGGYILKLVGTTWVQQQPPIEPRVFALSQNYPNPFNPATTISYQLSANSFVRLQVIDLLGRNVATLVDEMKSTGAHRATWDASGFSTGMYFSRLQAGTSSETKTMFLIK
jgi:photosystem II stability/assembly factor-like uncharacterized protein